MSKPPVAVGFDYAHNNRLILEANPFVDFVEFLFQQGYKLGKIELGWDLDKLSAYDVFVLGNMTDSYLETEEIKTVLEYVRKGGSLFVVSDEGGDYSNQNNISELCEHFGVTFNADVVIDETQNAGKPEYPIIDRFEHHFICQNVHQIVHSSGCSLTILKSREDENVDVTPLAFSGPNGRRRVFNGQEWVVRDHPGVPIMAACHYHAGKVLCLGNVSIFSSLGKRYGINALDDRTLLANSFAWLATKKKKGEGTVYYAVGLDADLYFWIQKLVQTGKWRSISDAVNFSLKVLRSSIAANEGDEAGKEDEGGAWHDSGGGSGGPDG